jgi:excisionase family DNA binding protein
MRVKEAAVRLDISSATIYGLIAAGKLRCHRVGLGRGAIRISEEHLAEFLAGAERGVELAGAVVAAPKVRVKLKHLHR